MKTKMTCLAVLVCVLCCLYSVNAEASEQSLWVRTTVLLEPAQYTVIPPHEFLIPGGMIPVAELGKGDLEEFDQDAIRRIERIHTKIRELEQTMRLDTLMVRQYQFDLVKGKTEALPALDLNPRLGANLRLNETSPEIATFDVEFLYDHKEWETPEFSGKPVTLSLKNADLRNVLGVFAQVTEVPFIIEPDVEGKLTVDFRGVPWDQALDLILRNNDLGWTMEGDTIHVARLETLNLKRDVLAKAAVAVGRAPGGLAMVAGRNGVETPTVVLLVEPLAEFSEERAELTSVIHFKSFERPVFARDEDHNGVVIVRGTVSEKGFSDVKILASPSEAAARATLEAVPAWESVQWLGKEGRPREIAVAFGIRITPPSTVDATERYLVEETEVVPGEKPGEKQITFRITDTKTGKVTVGPVLTCAPNGTARVERDFQDETGVPHHITINCKLSDDGEKVVWDYSAVQKTGKPKN